MSTSVNIITGDCREAMAALPEQHFHCCVTSPPYFGLRDYGHDGQVGAEPTPDEYVAELVGVFRDVWRVLRDDGTLWLNLGDSYASKPAGNKTFNHGAIFDGRDMSGHQTSGGIDKVKASGLKPKDLIGIPWRVAFALQADGWYLRDAVIWHKPAPMPGSQRDRCTSSYEFVFQLTKHPRYFFDMEAIKEETSGNGVDTFARPCRVGRTKNPTGNEADAAKISVVNGRTPRNVWKIAHEGYSGAHFATMPVELATRCIKASTSERGCCSKCGAPWERVVERDRKPTRPGDNNISDETGKANRDEQRHVTETRTTGLEPGCKCDDLLSTPCRVFDPFSGVGTTGVAARTLGRHYTGIELNAEYAAVSRDRIARALNPSTHRSDDEEHSSLFNRKAASNP